MDCHPTRAKRFKLIWTSQSEATTIECGEYVSIPEASDDLAAAEAKPHADYTASANFRYPHDIKAGTWRVVSI